MTCACGRFGLRVRLWRQGFRRRLEAAEIWEPVMVDEEWNAVRGFRSPRLVYHPKSIAAPLMFEGIGGAICTGVASAWLNAIVFVPRPAIAVAFAWTLSRTS
jgi:hypothetical protein